MFKPFLLSVFTAAVFCAVSDTTFAADFTTAAPHALILDFETGEVLFEKEARVPMAPASMTKIMTVDMVFEALKTGAVTLDTEFNVSEEAWRRGGSASGSSTMFLDLNSKVRVEDLLRGAVIQSGNDACIVLAEGLGGSETGFAAQMTARAKDLGLESAVFKNSTGWPHPEHQISTLDLAMLARHQIKSYPDMYPLYAERSFTWNNIPQGNRNPLLGKFTGADGMKTGSTEASGYGLVGTAKRGGERRIVVINGLPSKSTRASESLSLMEAAFSQFSIYELYKADTKVADLNVYMGKAPTVSVKLAEGVSTGLHISQRDNVKARVEYQVPAAPITAGQQVAELVVMSGNKSPRRYPLYAAEDVSAKSAFGKAWAVFLKKIRG